MIKKCCLTLMVLMAIMTLTACGGEKDKNTQAIVTNTPPDVKPTETQTNNFATIVPSPTPLLDFFKLPEQGIRPHAVMIDNEGTRSLPQGGLHLAQLVYEMIVEGGETRLMPVFWGTNPELIGPVRSSRHYFLDYVMEHDAIYIHFGYSPMAMKDISKFRINNINGVGNGGGIFWDLTKDRRNWQDSYTSMASILNYVKTVKYRTTTEKKQLFTYNSAISELPEDKKANKVGIRFSYGYTCGFTYDPVSKMYKRFRKGSPHMERKTGRQLTAQNILIQKVRSGGIRGDDKGRQTLSNIGKGEGWLVTQGKAQKIKWSKKSRTEQTQYTDDKGNQIHLNPGQTWIEIVPLNGKVTIE